MLLLNQHYNGNYFHHDRLIDSLTEEPSKSKNTFEIVLRGGKFPEKRLWNEASFAHSTGCFGESPVVKLQPHRITTQPKKKNDRKTRITSRAKL